MQTTIGAYDPDSRTVPVTFDHAGVTHDRAVNACHTGEGAYDAAATSARVADVARGVAVKIGLGVITNAPPPAIEPEEA